MNLSKEYMDGFRDGHDHGYGAGFIDGFRDGHENGYVAAAPRRCEYMKECCEACRLKLRIEKLDYSKGGCIHSWPEGYICLAFCDEGIACWMVGVSSEKGMCECYTPKEVQK